MSLLLETIRIENGAPQHLQWHQRRVTLSSQALWGQRVPIDLHALLTECPQHKSILRCRILYHRHGLHSLEFLPFQPRQIHRLGLVDGSSIDYPWKFADRHSIEQLRTNSSAVDDILLIRDGLLSDTSIANIALRIHGRWLTPRRPLLHGTTRERMLTCGLLFPADLRPGDLQQATGLAVLNAMVGFQELVDWHICHGELNHRLRLK
ncbi:hypothetical protein Selin_1636 [Desulfurispirillum indicum S5]|uniref:Aminotransferase class IV n=1 Tax=Desulfurispirillum indicum (strain ATCC BAA-1389 / DSM 22839 / S5) TaxID=653733 RepID=E6W0E8_DESIS|nr:aminotransferase class IV [Desulfurispirillum indicum]ADU66366.1 hypothetical protein Selin_1636 [Desulfurispirillum indicum S5]